MRVLIEIYILILFDFLINSLKYTHIDMYVQYKLYYCQPLKIVNELHFQLLFAR